MNIPVAMTLKGFTNSQNLNYVPANGELLLDKETNLLKIGDGKTKIADLPYVSTHVRIPEPVEFEPSAVAKEVIKKHKDLIASNNFDEFYNQLKGASISLIRDVTKMLLEAEINVREHLTTVPICIQDMLLGKPEVDDSWLEDLHLSHSTYIQNQKLNTKLYEVNVMGEFRKRICKALSIPDHLMTIKTGEN